MEVLVPVGAGMFLFSFFGEAKMDTRGTPCLAKNDTALKPAINSRSSDTFPLNEKHFNWKFIAEYGKSYFIILSHNTTQKRALLSQFIPFLTNKFISRNASSQMSRRIVNTTHQHHYSSYLLIYTYCGGVVKDCKVPFSLNFVRLKNY